MWTVPGLYGLLLVLRLLPDERALPRWLNALPIVANVIAWGWLIGTSTNQVTLFRHSATLSWGLFPLAVALGAFWLNRDERHAEFFDAALLVATMFSALWVASLGAQLPTPMSNWELGAGWMIDVVGGLMLLTALLGWHLANNSPIEAERLSIGLTRLQVLSVLFCVGALLCALPEASRLTLSQKGHLFFLLLAVGGLWLPTLSSDRTQAFAQATIRWLFAGAAYTVAWALVRLFALV